MSVNGVTFGTKHSYKDWGLILASRPEISPPKPKTNYVDIPAADGSLDLSESLTGEIAFENRTIKCEFYVIDARKRWSNIYSDILDYLHGQKMKITIDEDSTYFYTGRVAVNEWKSDKKHSTIVIEGTVEPYKMESFSSLENWEWDPFNFETGIIRDYGNLRVDDELTFTIQGSRKSVVPAFTVVSDDGSGLNVRYNGTTYSLPDGTSRVLNINLRSGNNVLYFTGNGTVSIDYRGGRL